MKKYICISILLYYVACIPAIEVGLRRGYYSGDWSRVNPVPEKIEPDSSITGISYNPYLQGYNDGMITAKNASTGGCLVGGCTFGVLGIAAGLYAPSLLFGDPYQYSENTQMLIVIASMVGGIAAGFGSVYLANNILDIKVPDPMSEDSLYRKGFTEGYRVTYKSQRLSDGLKGSAMGEGTACLGIAALTLMMAAIFASMW